MSNPDINQTTAPGLFNTLPREKQEAILAYEGPQDVGTCEHCGKPASFQGPCGWGGCPIGADL